MSREQIREGWVKLLEVSDPVKADLLLGCLQSNEVEAVLEAVPLSMLYVSVGRFASSYRLWVRQEHEEKALRLLEEQVPERELERAAAETPPDPANQSSDGKLSKK